MTKLETELRQYLNGQLVSSRRRLERSDSIGTRAESQGRIDALERTLNWLDNQPKGDQQ